MKFYKLDSNDSFIKDNKDYIKKVYSLKIDSRYIMSNVSKIFINNILDIITTIDEYNNLTKKLTDVIITSIGRGILIFGMESDNKILYDLVINNIYDYMEETSQSTLLDINIIEDNKYVYKLINNVLDKLKEDFNLYSNIDVSDICDAFTLIHEKYSYSDFSFYKVNSKNEILILEM